MGIQIAYILSTTLCNVYLFFMSPSFLFLSSLIYKGNALAYFLRYSKNGLFACFLAGHRIHLQAKRHQYNGFFE